VYHCICAEANAGEGLSEGDVLVGQLMKLSSMQSPTLAKTWFTLANWCYKWGRKAVDSAAYVHRLFHFRNFYLSLIRRNLIMLFNTLFLTLSFSSCCQHFIVHNFISS